MSDLPWVRFFPSDWLAGTRGMTAAETGIYITLVAIMYEAGEPIPANYPRLARVCGASNSAFKAALETLIEAGKISFENGCLWNERVGKETVYRAEKSEVGLKNVKQRWERSKLKTQQNQEQKNTTVLPSYYQTDTNQNQIPDREKEELRSSKKNSEKPAVKTPQNASPDTPPPKRRTSIRADWTPSQANLDYARSKNLTDQEIANAADQFRNHHLAKGTLFASWDAGWRTWVGNFRRFSGGAMAGRTQTGGSGQAVSLASVAARHRDEMLL